MNFVRAASAAVGWTALLAPSLDAQAPAGRPLTVADVLRIESVGQAVPAPDGAAAALVIKRAHAHVSRFTIDYLDGFERGDVWLVADSGGAARRVTDGSRDSVGFWAPLWSADGRRMAMLSTRGGDNVRLYTWDRASGVLQRRTRRGVDLSAPISAAGAQRPGFGWLDERRVLVALLPEGASPQQFNIEVAAMENAPRFWREAPAGRRATASVIDGGGSGFRPTGHRVVIVDAVTGEETLVVEAALRAAAVARDGRRAALVVDEGARPLRQDGRIEHNSRRRALHVLDLGAPARPARAVRGVVPSAASEPAWSPDGARLLILGRRTPDDAAEGRFVVNADEGSVQPLLPGYRVSAAHWDGRGRLLALARPDTGGGGRADWWAVADGAARNLTASLPAPAGAGVPLADGSVLALADGRLVRIDGDGAAGVEVAGLPRVRAIVLPRAGTPSPDGRVLVQAEGSPARYWVVYPAARTAHAVAAPDPYARAEALLGRSVLWASARPERTAVSTTSPGDEGVRERLTLNPFLAEIADGRRMMIEYRSRGGDSLRAQVILPPAYEPGRRYPAVAWVYAGTVFRDTTSLMSRKNHPHPLNLQLLAARGYVVLTPSLPLAPEGTASEPMADLAAAVLPAVDRLVELGIADSARVGVAGQSYGGYTAMALLTQTGRFRAAVSLAGLSNLASMYGTFDIRRRYSPAGADYLFGANWAEAGQGRMGAAPWQTPERYVRNSPVFFADRITTPLLLIQGDQDFVPMAQGEEMFTALNRLGRPVRFVRYWGEGHVFKSPANIAHMWEQVFAWFDHYLRADAPPAASGTGW